METGPLIIFIGALVINAGSPGPSVAAMVARVISQGWRDVIPFMAAMWIGEVIWLSVAVLGLAALAEQFYWTFLTIKYLGVAYLLFLAWKMWRAPVDIGPNEKNAPKGSGVEMFFAGFAVTMGNPKIMIFYMALLPSIFELKAVSVGGWLELVLITLVVLFCIDTVYVSLAMRARMLLKSPRALRLSNRLSAGVMGAAATAIASR